MNLRDLKYLIALADHRHFSKAAQACFVSQPTLSTQIKKLEQLLDVQLVERNPRQVLLTAVGEAIAARARVVLGEVDAIRDLARLSREPDAGTLTLGVFPTLGPYWLAHVVPRLVERFPKLKLLLVEEKTETLVDRLANGKIDVAVLAQPVSHDHFEHAALFDESFVLAVPKAHPLAQKRHVNVTDLAHQPLLLLADGHCLRDQALAVCALAGTREANIADAVTGSAGQNFRATSLETLRQMVAAGVGVTLLPALATLPPVAPNPALALVTFTAPQPMRSIALFWRSGSARAPFFKKIVPFLGSVPEDALAS
jgi:LysR family transcriptional regulator, hydrogen peroxide-inducible genes activator